MKDEHKEYFCITPAAHRSAHIKTNALRAQADIARARRAFFVLADAQFTYLSILTIILQMVFTKRER